MTVNDQIGDEKLQYDINREAAKISALKSNSANLKTKVDKLDIDKLVTVPVDLSKLSDVVKIMLLKRMYITN